MRVLTFLLSVLVMAAPPEPTGWSYAGARRLGVPKPSADHRTFMLDGARVTDPAQLAVRAGGRRVDVLEHRPPLRSPEDDSGPGQTSVILPWLRLRLLLAGCEHGRRNQVRQIAAKSARWREG